MENIDGLDASDLGEAETIEFKKIAGDDLCFISGCKNPKSVSILLRAGTSQGLEESERTMHDALCVIASVHDRSKIVAGGGGVEMELAQKLLEIASKQTGKEQIAIETYARALEIIPITLAENAGLDPIDVIADLRSAHSKADNKFMGLDIYQGKVVNNKNSGIIEPVANIDQILKSATELSTMILRIDDMIKAKQSEGGPGGPGGPPGY
jgi:archaeal chaperonin